MKTLLYFSSLTMGVFVMMGCAKSDLNGTYVNLTVTDRLGIPQEGRNIYVFKDADDQILNKKPNAALFDKVTDARGQVQFNLEQADVFESNVAEPFSFQVLKPNGNDQFVIIGSFEKDIKPGDIISQTIRLQ